MENNIINIIKDNGELLVSSREVAKNFGKEHSKVCRDINTIISQSPSLAVENMIIESEYITSRGRTYHEYLLTRDGFTVVVMGFEGAEALAWKLKYIKAFNEMEKSLKQGISNQDQAMLSIIKADGDIERALAIREYTDIVQAPLQLEIKEQKVEIEIQKEELDIYSRFICDKLSTITKSELALRLDTNTIRVAKLLKALGIYTNKTNQISAKFLDLHPNVKIIKSNVVQYRDGNGELREKKDWIYTGEGSNMVVIFLVNAGLVVYCENKGFKLKGMNSDEAFSLIDEHRL